MEKIDVVILWVDDKDPVWRKKRDVEKIKLGLEVDDNVRFRDWDNLQYVFRGIEKFAPWVNKIFLVTDNQKPIWLNDNESVVLIDHKEIIDNKYLPTFNSNVIELNIHNIPGLSEKFIYFNDDMFLTQKVDAEDFFENDLPKDTAFLNMLQPFYGDNFQKMLYNNLAIINKEFDVHSTILSKKSNWFNFKIKKYNINNMLLFRWSFFAGIYDHHLPISFRKSTFEHVWSKYQKNLVNTLENKFRNDSDYTAWLFRYWQIASNDFRQRSIDFGKFYGIDNLKTAFDCAKDIEKSKYKAICVNDTKVLESFEEAKKIINSSLEKILPEKSSFEI